MLEMLKALGIRLIAKTLSLTLYALSFKT